MIAKELITSHVVPLKAANSGAFALSLMEEARLSHLPIVEGHDFMGLISDKEILAMNEPDHEIGSYKITLNRGSVTGDQHIYEVLRVYSSLKLSMLPVVTDKNQYIGAILLPTLVYSLAELIGLSNPGGIIIIEINDKDYNLTDIVQIVESNDTKILSCFVTSNPDTTKLEVTIKVNRMDIGPLLQTFFRLDYFVKASWSKEDSYSEGLQDRFDALMNYLNI
ncbi:MAG: CBS domain-containing protein [Bacteroidales bacterium]|nr:CBS domain-containing protein [Bacteroidales bacterium]